MATQEAEEKKVVTRGLSPGGVVIASEDGRGAKDISVKELEAALRQGVALEATPVRPWGRSQIGLQNLNFLESTILFQIF